MRSKKVLKPRGHLISILNSGTGPHVLWNYVHSWLGGPSYSVMWVQPNGSHMQAIADLLEERKIKPVIDRRYPLEQAMEAHRYLEEGHARGKVILDL